MKKWLGALTTALFMMVCSGAENVSPPVPPALLTVPLMTTGPVIDGEIKPREWQGPTVRGFYDTKTRLFDPRGGSFQIACDGRMLFLAVDSPLHPRYGALTRRLQNGDVGQVFLDDSVELWVAPGLDGTPERIFQFVFNTANVVAMQTFDTKSGQFSPAQKSKELCQQNRVLPGRWTAEIGIPLADLGLTSATEGCRIRVGRSYKMPFGPTITSAEPGAYTDPSTMVKVGIVEKGPTVSEPDWQAEAPAVTLTAPTAESASLSVNGKTHTVPAGEQIDVPLTPGIEADGSLVLDLQVTDDKGKLLHRRRLHWKKPEGEIWEPVL